MLMQSTIVKITIFNAKTVGEVKITNGLEI